MERFDTICLSSAYLAPVQYYVQCVRGSSILVEQHDNYIKQTYRNRCNIMDANGPISLTIPVVSASGVKIKMKDVEISDHGNWQHVHWNAIKSAYNSSPFFEYYQDDFHPFYHKKYKYLFDFNEQLQHLLLKLLNIEEIEINKTEAYVFDYESDVLDLRETIHPKISLENLNPHFDQKAYYQVFMDKNGFVPNLSIIDLLFNMGNESLLVLHESISE